MASLSKCPFCCCLILHHQIKFMQDFLFLQHNGAWGEYYVPRSSTVLFALFLSALSLSLSVSPLSLSLSLSFSLSLSTCSLRACWAVAPQTSLLSDSALQATQQKGIGSYVLQVLILGHISQSITLTAGMTLTHSVDKSLLIVAHAISRTPASSGQTQRHPWKLVYIYILGIPDAETESTVPASC